MGDCESPECNLGVAIQVFLWRHNPPLRVISTPADMEEIIPRFRRESVCPFCWHCCQAADRADVGTEPLTRLICGGPVGAPGSVLGVVVHSPPVLLFNYRHGGSGTVGPNLKKT